VDGGILLVAKGRIGSVTASTFADAINAALAAAPRMIIDLTDVDYISGAGVRVLQRADATDRAPTILCGLHDAVRITLALVALNCVVVVKDRKEALESLITSDSGPPTRSS
jgi:anti-sigma B factor antagonist